MPVIRSLLFAEVKTIPAPVLFARVGFGLVPPAVPFCTGVWWFDESEEEVSKDACPFSDICCCPGIGGIPGDKRPFFVTVITDVDREPSAKSPLVFGADATLRMNLLADF